MSVLVPSTAERTMAPPIAAFFPSSATWVRVGVRVRAGNRGGGLLAKLGHLGQS